jgi:hypothetical protein
MGGGLLSLLLFEIKTTVVLVLASSHCSEPHWLYTYLQLQDLDGPQDEQEPLIFRPVLAILVRGVMRTSSLY